MKLISGLLSLLAGLGLILGTLFVVNSQEYETTLEVTAEGGDVVFIYTAPGVLDLVNDEVTVTMSAPGEEIQWGFANIADVEAYVAGASSREITGLSDWETLSTTTDEGTEEANASVAERGAEKKFTIASSDLWIQNGTGTETVTETFTPDAAFPHSLIASTTSGVAPEMTLAWVRSNEFGSPVVWYVIGALLTLIGTFLLLNWYQDRDADRENPERRKTAKKKAEAKAAAETSVLPVYKGDLAAQGTAREIQRTHTDSALGAAVLPGSNRAEHFRSRELSEEDRVVLPVADEPAVEDAEEEQQLTPESAAIPSAPSAASGDDVVVASDADDSVLETEISADEPAEEVSDVVDPVDGVDPIDDNEDGDAEVVKADDVDEPAQVSETTDEDGDVAGDDTKDDWRALWNLSWGKNRGKEEENNA